MTETILYLFAGVLILAVLRAILGIVFKGVAEFFGVSSRAATQRQPSPPGAQSVPEVLQKDPVCGTFVAPSTALHKTVGGQTYYFCSPECQRKFKG